MDDLSTTTDSVPEDTGALADSNGSGAVMDNLTAFFAGQQDQSQAEDPISETDEAAEVPAEANTEEPEAEKPEASEADETDAPAAAADTDDTEQADFDALTPSTPEFIDDFDALKAKFPRNSSNELLTEMAEYGKFAKKGHEIVEAIGGEEFVPGLTSIAKSLQGANYRDVFGGIAETAGVDGLAYSIAEAMKIGFVEADAMAADPDPAKAQWGKTMLAVVDSVIEQRFGADMNIAKLSQLAQWDQAGWFEKIEKWSQDEYVDHAEFDELLEKTNDPKLLEASLKIKELETKLGEKEVAATDATAKRELEVETSFGKMAADQIGQALNGVVWKNSPLRDIASDTAETKAEKALMRSVLEGMAVNAFQQNADRSKLVEGYKTGKQKTAIYQKDFVEAINKAVLGTREQTAIAERMFAKIYGKNRNSQLANKQQKQAPETAEAQPFQPTQTTSFGREKLTGDQIKKNLLDQISALG